MKGRTFAQYWKSMNVARRSDGLLPADQLDALLDLIVKGSSDLTTLCESMRALRGASPVRTVNAVAFLEEIGVAKVDGALVSATEHIQNATPETRRRDLTEVFVRTYAAKLDDKNVGTAFQAEENRDLWVDSLQLPFRELGYPFMLVALGVAEREALSSRFWRIATGYAPQFLEALERVNSSAFLKRKFGEEELAKALAAQAAAGREAEDWVLNFERDRLAKHFFSESIRRVSDEDVSAGYDILSFDTRQSLIHDRFVEVKSFRDEPQFYWSRGEMEAARQLSGRYWLYLIDRSRLAEPGYEPDMIRDPAAYFLDRTPEGWALADDGVLFRRSLP